MMDAPAAMGFSALQMQLADTNPNSAAGEQLQAQMQQANAESFKSFLLSIGFTPPPQGPLMQAYNPAAEQAYQANLNNIAYFAAGPVLGVGIPLTRALGGSEQAAADAGEMGAGLLLGAVGVPGDAALSEVANGSAADNIVPSTTDATAGAIGVPVSTSPNPLSPVQGVDAFGNEIYYRTMSPEQYETLMQTGSLPPTTETSISPVLSYSSQYDGVTVQFTVAPGTSEQLQEIGIAQNPPAAAQLPNLSTQTGPWMQTNVQFKVEGGQMTTQLGQGPGIDIFNQNIIQYQQVR